MHHLPRGGGGNAAHLARADALYVVVPGLPSRAGKICAAEIRGVQPGLQSSLKPEGARGEAREGIQDSEIDKLFDMPPMKAMPIDR